MLARGFLLGQSRPANTTAAALYTATLETEVSAICICNVTSSASTFRLFHDEGGTTFDNTNALYFDYPIPGNDTVWVSADSMGAGLQLQIGDSLGIRTGTADALVFTAYGTTLDLAPQEGLRNG